MDIEMTIKDKLRFNSSMEGNEEINTKVNQNIYTNITDGTSETDYLYYRLMTVPIKDDGRKQSYILSVSEPKLVEH